MIFDKPINTDTVYDLPAYAEPIEVQFRRALQDRGFNPPGPITFTNDGKPVRFDTVKANRKAGWYFLNEKGCGAFGDWSTDEEYSFSPKYCRELTAEERQRHNEAIEEAKRQAAQFQEEVQRHTAAQAREEWSKADPATPYYPYLCKKGVGSYGLRTINKGETLLIPMYDSSGQIVSLEKIFPTPTAEDPTKFTKHFKTGGKKKGCYFIIGDGKPDYMAEGYATGASIYEATGKPVVIAFDAGNLQNVAPLFPGITIVADNDESKTGQIKAEAAAKAGGGQVKLIPAVGMDANDYAVKYGKDVLREFLEPGSVDLRQDPTQPMQSSFRLHKGSEILQKDKPRSYLIKNWLPKGNALVSVYGGSGSCKTFVAVDMCLHIATGQQSWCDNNVNQGNVIYLCGEAFPDLKERIAVWLSHHGYRGDAAAEILDQHFRYSDEPIALDEKLQQLIDQISADGWKPDLIVVDTLIRHMAGNENDTQDASKMINAFGVLQRSYDAVVAYVHHTGQDPEKQDRERGSSAFKGACDRQLQVVGLKRSGERGCAVIQGKNKGGKEEDPLYFSLVDYAVPDLYDIDGKQIKRAVLEQIDQPPENEKSEQQRYDESAVNLAVYDYGRMEDGKLYISWEDLIKGLIGRLKPKGENTTPYTVQAIKEKMYINQKKAKQADRLISYGYWEPEGEAQEKGKKHPLRFQILDDNTILSWNLRHKEKAQENQQTEQLEDQQKLEAVE